MIKISPNSVNFLVLTSEMQIKILLFSAKVTGNIALIVVFKHFVRIIDLQVDVNIYINTVI